MLDINPFGTVPRLDINGKFLGGNLNGVHRTAAHYCDQLVKRMADGYEVRLLAPHASYFAQKFSRLVPTQVRGRLGHGQGWEMITLPRHAQGNLLVNFCNLAPLLHNNSVVMIHDAQTFLYPKDYSGRQAVAYRHLLPWIGRRARRVLTISEFARQTLVAHGIASLEKIDVVHNGTDHLLDVASDRSVLARHALTPRSYVLVIGTAKGYKNIRSVFEALQSDLSGGPRLVVAGGPGAEVYRKKGWEPPEHTIFTGFVSDAELRALYENAAVFIFPSLTEGFGLPPVEAMHCGTPVIAARAGAMPEVCGDGALLVNAGDTRAFRTAIEAVLQDRQLRDELTGRGRKRAGELTWDRAGERLETIISGLLRTGRKSSLSGPCDQS
ncbi:glycosyltransferase family 1 protein [Novosphingobium sp. TCA1]|uniref:glycosyltransferase family 4 protein n=1 Tax=Novosphingobium sp. TCA1 TaxID=2682474 RepID=UPI001F33473B|nr:glycosyltransferase family 1 protein [Novosphingobium sp. TCA1]